MKEEEKKYSKFRTMDLKDLLQKTSPPGTQQFLNEIPAGSNYTFHKDYFPSLICARYPGWHTSNTSFGEHLKITDLLFCDSVLLTKSQEIFVRQCKNSIKKTINKKNQK